MKLNRTPIRFVFPVLLLSMISLPSCSDFLEEKPYTQISEKDYYASPKRLGMASLSIYGVLNKEYTYGKYIPILEAGTDLEQTNVTTVSTNTTSLEQVASFNVTDKFTCLEKLWQLFYEGINRANMVIVNAPMVPVATEKEAIDVKKYIAEAKTLRAFFYHELICRWGDVPFRITPSSLSENLFLKRTPRNEIYDSIIKDLEDVIPDLPWHDEDPSMKGRINKGVAMGLLSRICLFAGGYSLNMAGQMVRPTNYQDYYRKAERITHELIASGKHVLNPQYEQIFKNICENTLEPKESMFEVDMAYLYGSKENAGSIGTITTGVKIVKHSTLFNCNPKVFTNYTAYQKYADKDLRREASIADYWLEGVDFSKKHIDKKQSNQWSCAKWRRDWHKTYPSNWSLSDVNYIILRYADVLLMRAEILNELDGPTAEAVELVNQVRRRGYGLDMNQLSELADVPDTVKTDKDTFFKFLTDEYAREFLGEGRRRFHLIRWNLLKDKIKETDQWFDTNYKTLHSLKNYLPGDCFVAGKSELWPLPYREIKENQGSLGPNNPGYE